MPYGFQIIVHRLNNIIPFGINCTIFATYTHYCYATFESIDIIIHRGNLIFAFRIHIAPFILWCQFGSYQTVFGHSSQAIKHRLARIIERGGHQSIQFVHLNAWVLIVEIVCIVKTCLLHFAFGVNEYRSSGICHPHASITARKIAYTLVHRANCQFSIGINITPQFTTHSRPQLRGVGLRSLGVFATHECHCYCEHGSIEKWFLHKSKQLEVSW